MLETEMLSPAIPYAFYADKLRDALDLGESPIAAKIIRERPGQLKPIRHKATVCMMMQHARGGNSFYCSGSDILCGGRDNLGIGKSPLSKLEDIVLSREKLFESRVAARKALNLGKTCAPDIGRYLLLAPLDKFETIPDVVIITGVPSQISRLLYINAFDTGEFNVEFMEPLCTGAIAAPVSTGKIGLSVMDVACRILGKFREEEMIVGIPYERLGKIVKNIDRSSAGTAKLSTQFRIAASILQRNMPDLLPYQDQDTD
jgi:uncharacterized protein (DUF169 family)